MKKICFLLLVIAVTLSFSACGGDSGSKKSSSKETKTTETKKKFEPTVESVIEGIKNNFKDPDSVQIAEGSWARVKNGDEESETECYIICSVRAKNSFGGYGEPQAYVIHCKDGNYKIVEEYDNKLMFTQKKFNELGCGLSMGLRSSK